MPVYEIQAAYEACRDAEGLAGGINATAAIGSAGLEVVGAVMNPVAALVKAPLQYLLDWIMSWCTPLKEAVDFLLGDPAGIRANGDDWHQVAVMLEEVATEHRATRGDFGLWTGDGASAYREDVHPSISTLLESTGATARSFGDNSIAVGAIIGAVREMIWGVIVDLLSEVIASALIALAAAIPTVGGSIATFTGWCAARMGSAFLWVGQKLQKCGGLLGKLGDVLVRMSTKFGDAARALGQLSGRFRAGSATSDAFRTRFNQVYEALQQIPGIHGAPGAATAGAQGATGTDRDG